ncbi:MAG: hypothetical protein ACOY3J_01810 [Bacillota bacterium]|uniref:DUF2802 domain-containing protein n=1 Tax=Thermanaerosceptrum fracticalcis TaxID=1712410 RepID=A0A7G6E0Y7_THEFR|nr:hypothetical protein [Thermanaerosceptrum fracticalcis]QNB45741.1 hypothetical protein BR63_05100 [Thermanaerosceptrum fracticalcis]
MVFLNIFILICNILLMAMLGKKTKVLQEINRENRLIQKNVQTLVEENSKLTNLILDELESKLAEARQVIEFFEQNTLVLPQKQEDSVPKKSKVLHSAEKPLATVEETPLKKSNNSPVDLLRMGMSIREIAEKLNMTQGEIALKLNLQEKMENYKYNAK